MKEIVDKLINEYYEPGLITTVMIPMKGAGGKDGKLIYKEARMRTAKAWDVKDEETGEFSDDNVVNMIEKIRKEKAEQLYQITVSIIKSQNVQTQEVINGEKYLAKSEENKIKGLEHPQKMAWCLLRLNKLGVVSFFIEQFMQQINDKDGDPIGWKIVQAESITGSKKDLDEDDNS